MSHYVWTENTQIGDDAVPVGFQLMHLERQFHWGCRSLGAIILNVDK